jgi:hypothetical protein
VIPAASARMSLRPSAIWRSSSIASSRLPLGGVSHCGAVEKAVEQLILRGHTPLYRTNVRLRYRPQCCDGTLVSRRLSRRSFLLRLLRPHLGKHALFLGMHYSADTLGSAHGFPGSPDHPNRANEGDTSKVWPWAELCPQLNGSRKYVADGQARSGGFPTGYAAHPVKHRLDVPPRPGRPGAPARQRCRRTHRLVSATNHHHTRPL